MFAGLRPESEIWRLDWSKIDFTRKQIDVEPLATKNNGDNASVRWVEMPDNLIEWLLPFRRKAGPVSPTGDSYFTPSASQRRRQNHHSHTTLRPCFCSYHYAAHNDAGKTMAQAGHTNPRTFFRHYRPRVQRDDAKRFLNLAGQQRRREKISFDFGVLKSRKNSSDQRLSRNWQTRRT